MVGTRPVVLALAIGALAACQRAEDPAQAGFLDGILNQVDDTYDERLAAKQQERRDLDALNAALSQQVDSLRAQKAANAARIVAAEERLRATDRRIAELRARYAGAEADYRGELATLEEVAGEVERQRLILAAARDGGPGQERVIEQSVQRVDELSRIVDLLPE